MKKKYRDIIVDGKKYGWSAHDGGLSIWEQEGQKRKILSVDRDRDCPSTPGLVAQVIKEFNEGTTVEQLHNRYYQYN